jgi:hypothetical protein
MKSAKISIMVWDLISLPFLLFNAAFSEGSPLVLFEKQNDRQTVTHLRDVGMSLCYSIDFN